MAVVTPVLFVSAIVFCKLMYLAVNDCMWATRQRMKMDHPVQRVTVVVYMCAISAIAGGAAYLGSTADKGLLSSGSVNPMTASLPLALGCFALAIMVVVNTSWRVRESIYDLGAHALPGAETKEIRIGQESWTALGRVHVNYGGSEHSGNMCVQSLDFVCGGRGTCCGAKSGDIRKARSLRGGATPGGSMGEGGGSGMGEDQEFGSGVGSGRVF
eukprot:g2118.t1